MLPGCFVCWQPPGDSAPAEANRNHGTWGSFEQAPCRQPKSRQVFSTTGSSYTTGTGIIVGKQAIEGKTRNMLKNGVHSSKPPECMANNLTVSNHWKLHPTWNFVAFQVSQFWAAPSQWWLWEDAHRCSRSANIPTQPAVSAWLMAVDSTATNIYPLVLPCAPWVIPILRNSENPLLEPPNCTHREVTQKTCQFGTSPGHWSALCCACGGHGSQSIYEGCDMMVTNMMVTIQPTGGLLKTTAHIGMNNTSPQHKKRSCQLHVFERICWPLVIHAWWHMSKKTSMFYQDCLAKIALFDLFAGQEDLFTYTLIGMGFLEFLAIARILRVQIQPCKGC